MPLTVDFYGDRTSWLAARRDPFSIGASEAAAALGVSPYMDPWAFWELKQGHAEARDEREEVVLSRGSRWEPVVLAEYADASGAKIVEPGAHFGRKGTIVTLSNTAFPWLRESPDAFVIDRYGVLGHAEAKTAMDRDAWTSERGMVIDRWSDGCENLMPPYYAVQAYVQLAVTDLPWNDVCALVPSNGWLEVRWLRLMRDNDTQDAIVESLGAWREKHLIGGDPPDVDGSSACNRYLSPDERPAETRFARGAKGAAAMREVAALRAQTRPRRSGCGAHEPAAVSAGESVVRISDDKKGPYGQAEPNAGRTTIDSKRLKDEFPDAYAACKRTSAPSVSFATYRFEKE
jgi:predicted phage-related endonuclease